MSLQFLLIVAVVALIYTALVCMHDHRYGEGRGA